MVDSFDSYAEWSMYMLWRDVYCSARLMGKCGSARGQEGWREVVLQVVGEFSLF